MNVGEHNAFTYLVLSCQLILSILSLSEIILFDLNLSELNLSEIILSELNLSKVIIPAVAPCGILPAPLVLLRSLSDPLYPYWCRPLQEPQQACSEAV